MFFNQPTILGIKIIEFYAHQWRNFVASDKALGSEEINILNNPIEFAKHLAN